MKQLPNLLSIGRIVLTPYVVVAIWRRDYELALILCFLAGLSDALDGFLARVLKAKSKAGAYLDPVADKILLSAIFVTLALDRAIPAWLAGMVVGRDVLILGFVAWAFRFTRQRHFPPSLWGKVSTIVQIFYVLAALLYLAGYGDRQAERMLMWATAGATAWSGLHYGWLARKMLLTPGS